MGGMSSGLLQFYSEHPSMFWLSFLPKMSDRCKINFFRKQTSVPFQPYMARFLIQSQEIMVNFSITDFCSVLTARPSCSKSNTAPSRNMIKIQGKFFWKLDSYTFPTPPTSYFYHFQIIPVNSLKLAYVQVDLRVVIWKSLLLEKC